MAIDIDSSDEGLTLSIDTKNWMIFRAIDLPLYFFRFRKFSSDLRRDERVEPRCS